jgi:hypothetical protein
MPAEEFGGFDTGLSHVVNRLRTLLVESAQDWSEAGLPP